MKHSITAKIILTVAAFGVASPHIALAEQEVQKFDSTVTVDSGAIASMSIVGGEATTAAGSAIAEKGAKQKIGEMKTKVSVKKGAIASMTIVNGKAYTAAGSVIAK